MAFKTKSSNGSSAKLWRLGNLIRTQVADAKAQNKLVQTSETYVRPKFATFEYKNEGAVNTRHSMEYFDKSQWRWKHQHEFVQTLICSSPQFQECAKSLKKDFAKQAPQIEQSLQQFAMVVAAAAVEDVSNETLVEFVSRYLADLNGSPAQIKVSIWLIGLWLKQEEISLPGMQLRRPKPADLEIEEPLSLALLNLRPRSTSAPPAIAEFEIRARSGVDAQEHVERVTGALRLFRLGSVQEVQYSLSSDSLLLPAGTHGPIQTPVGCYKFEVDGSDTEKLASFIQKLTPLLPLRFPHEAGARQPADIAFFRYTEAVLRGGDLEGRITSGITSLEALFLKGKERAELAQRLSLRIASLLRLLEQNPFEVQEKVHQAYDIRSTHIHGGQVEPEKLRNADDLCRNILEYARLSLVIFLQLKGVIEKDDFIGKLDRALLEFKSLDRIKQQLDSLLVPK